MVFTADRENPTLPLHHLCIYLSACLSTIYHTYTLYVCAYDMYMYVCMYVNSHMCVLCVSVYVNMCGMYGGMNVPVYRGSPEDNLSQYSPIFIVVQGLNLTF